MNPETWSRIIVDRDVTVRPFGGAESVAESEIERQYRIMRFFGTGGAITEQTSGGTARRPGRRR